MNVIKDVYWDSCCWLGLIKREEEWFSELKIVFECAQRGEARLWISTITYLEVIKLPAEDRTPKPWPDENIKQVDNLFELEYVKRVQLDVLLAKKAREIYRTKSELRERKQWDAIHLATALQHNIDEFHTADRRDLLRLDGKLPRNDGRPLRICAPKDSSLLDQGTLRFEDS
jgi:predicted nucleic acid-binding protein